MKIQRQHFSPQLFKDPECWSGRSLELTTSRVTARCSNQVSHRCAVAPKFEFFENMSQCVICSLYHVIARLQRAHLASNKVIYLFIYNNFICKEHRKKGAAREELNPHIRQPPVGKDLISTIKRQRSSCLKS